MLSTLNISSLKNYLDGQFPEGWYSLETPTILLHLGVTADDLLMDKIGVLKVLYFIPESFSEDILFFLHATEVINGFVSDFNTFPEVTSLEIAFAIIEVSKILNVTPDNLPVFSSGVKEVVKHSLIEDGYSFPIWPFTIVGITGLTLGATEKDMLNKANALKEYINGMYSKSGN